MPDDLTIVAQYAKSNRDTPSEVYNAACRLLDERDKPQPDVSDEQEPPFFLREERLAIALKRMGELVDRRGEELKETNAAIARVKAVRDGWYGKPFMGDYADELDVALDGPESHRDGRTPKTLGTPEGQKAREAQEAAKACEGFHWIGQSFATCDNCARPAWEHKGHHVPGNPFTDEGSRVEEFKPGEADAIRAKWGSRP